MVIANSNSTDTLVSLNDVRKIDLEEGTYRKASTYIRTDILLPNDAADDDDSSSCCSTPQYEQYLYLPSVDDEPVDVCLRSIPQVMETADELLANAPLHFTVSSSERLLYVGQGEVAYSTSQQCDVIASDKATTCHILAFRSTSEKGPMVSLTHIDTVGYESCIRRMITEHKLFHVDSEEKKSEHANDDRINIDAYLLGGFDDDDNASRAISNFLLNLLAQVAAEQSHEITLTLKLCAISSMNDDGHSCPIGRGLGISLKTGDAFLAVVDSDVAGPSPELRSARLWSGNAGKKLSLIHFYTSNNVVIQPFRYSPLQQMDALLALPDAILIRYTSTSPDVEEAGFCNSVRSTLAFMKKLKCESVFGPDCRRPAVFRRINTSNLWHLDTQF
jgi:hypothetical protein